MWQCHRDDIIVIRAGFVRGGSGGSTPQESWLTLSESWKNTLGSSKWTPRRSPGPLSKGTVEVIGDSYFSANNAQLLGRVLFVPYSLHTTHSRPTYDRTSLGDQFVFIVGWWYLMFRYSVWCYYSYDQWLVAVYKCLLCIVDGLIGGCGIGLYNGATHSFPCPPFSV